MANIQQNPDGSYSKGYSDVEINIIQSISTEISERIKADQAQWIEITGVKNTVDQLIANAADLNIIQASVTKNISDIATLQSVVNRLASTIGVNSYSKEEMDPRLILWKVEQIPHIFVRPTNEIFANADLDDISVGYSSFPNVNIDEPHDHHIPENTMRRYTLSAYVETPRDVTFQFYYADRLTLYVDHTLINNYMATNGNFGGVRTSDTVTLKEGWNKIQILIANENQRGGIKMESNLYEQADYLTNLDTLSGMISGDRIQAGTLDESHFAPDMDLVVHTLTATASDKPGVIVGDPLGCGILQIGDKTITKCLNEPFVFNDGIRVDGYIFASQLLIDEDFIRAGAGMLLDKIKDPVTGFTRIYEIINDMKVINGGGLIIEGDAQIGYKFTNSMDLKAHPNGGIKVEGNAVDGYMLTNIMELLTAGGIEVVGDATNGYTIKNVMRLAVADGLSVEGFPWTNEGYFLKNTMYLTTEGLIATPIYATGSAGSKSDGYKGWHIINDTKIHAGKGIGITKHDTAGEYTVFNMLDIDGRGIIITPEAPSADGISKYILTNDTQLTNGGCQGIMIEKGKDSFGQDLPGSFVIKNTMKLISSPAITGPVQVSGDACQGYVLTTRWPVINNPDRGMSFSHDGNGTYSTSFTGLLSATAGKGISVSTGGDTRDIVVTNTGVTSLTAVGTGFFLNQTQGDIVLTGNAVTNVVATGSVQASITNGVMSIHGTDNDTVLQTVQGDAYISGQVTNGGRTLRLSFDDSALPDPAPPVIVDPTDPRIPGISTLQQIPGTHGEGEGGYFRIAPTTNANSGTRGIGNGNVIFNDSNSMTVTGEIRGEPPVGATSANRLTITVFITEFSTTGSPLRTASSGEITISTSYQQFSITVQKGSLDSTRSYFVGVRIENSNIAHNRAILHRLAVTPTFSY